MSNTGNYLGRVVIQGLQDKQSFLSFLHRFVNLIEVFDREQAFLKFVHLDGGCKNVVQIEIADLAAPLDHVSALAMGADNAAAVNFNLSVLFDQAELHCIPKKAA